MIVHELAHVLNNAAIGNRPTELFYRDSPIAEAGFEMTAQLFGGPVEWNPELWYTPPCQYAHAYSMGKSRQPRRHIALRKWPSATALGHSLTGTGSISWQISRDLDILWRIPLT